MVNSFIRTATVSGERDVLRPFSVKEKLQLLRLISGEEKAEEWRFWLCKLGEEEGAGTRSDLVFWCQLVSWKEAE